MGRAANPDPLECLEYTASLEQKLQTLSKLNALRNREDADEWYETRPYQFYPDEKKDEQFYGLSIERSREIGVVLLPLVRVKKDESESYIFLHLGRFLCGHNNGIIYGGLLATLLDKSFWRMVRTIIFKD